MWTKSQKLSAAVLGLAVVAFGVDRWVLGTPEKPDGETASQFVVNSTTAETKAPKPSAAAAAVAVPAPAQATTLASRLAAMAEARRFQYVPAGDAFRPSDAWLASAEPPAPVVTKTSAPPAAASVPVAPKVDHAKAFAKKHTLTAVMKKHNGGMAIVDGKLYEPGQTLDGFKLTAVGLADATFTGKGTKVTLRLAGQMPVAIAR